MRLVKFFSPFVLITLLFWASCSQKLDIQLFHQADDSVDATQYHTFEFYGWAENSDSLMTQMAKQKIEKAFAKEFNLRDLTLVEENGDLVVTLFVLKEQKTETVATTVGYSGYSGYGGYGGYGGYSGYGGYGGYAGYGPGYGWGGGMSTSTVYTQQNYNEGAVIIDIFDAKQQLLIYEAVGAKKIDGQLMNDQRLLELVARSMMYNFQVKPVDKKKK